MKTVLFSLILMSCTCLAAPSTSDKSSVEDVPLSFSTVLPPTTIKGMEYLKPEYYRDLYQSFLDPIYRSDFSSVIHRIEIDCNSGVASGGTADIYLQTGEHISLHKPDSFFNSQNSDARYDGATKYVFKQLETILKKNPKLKTFFRENFPKRKPY